MATLAGRQTRTEITSLEVVSDDSKWVLKIGRSAGKTILRVRDANDNEWAFNSHSVYTLTDEQKSLVAQAISASNVLMPKPLDDVPSASFRLPQPEPEPEPNCSQLDIERAKAENLREQAVNVKAEMVLDHSRDKHTSDVQGCPSCETRIRPGYGDGSYPPAEKITDSVYPDDEEFF